MSEFDKPIIIIDGEPQQVQGIISFNVEKPQQCDDCGKVKELRPYGPGGSVVCFQCAMEDEAGAKRQMSKLMGWDE